MPGDLLAADSDDHHKMPSAAASAAAAAGDDLPSEEEMRKLLKPSPTDEQILAILHEHYCRNKDEKASIVDHLDSYDDCNFKVSIGDQVYLLKVHNGLESKDLVKCLDEASQDFYKAGYMKSVIHLQNALIELCAEHDFVANKPIRPIMHQQQGRESSPVVLVDLPVLSQAHSPCKLAVRLLSWIPGHPMSCANVGIEELGRTGRVLGALDKILDHLNANSLIGALEKFGSSGSLLGHCSAVNLSESAIPEPPRLKQRRSSILPVDRFRVEMMARKTSASGISSSNSVEEDSAILDDSLLIPARRYHQWDGKNTADLRKFTQYIADKRRRHMVLSILDTFQKEILDSGASSQFRVGVIHGDFNDGNILVGDDLNVCGVIDFGDTVETWRVLEISVAMAYAMLTSYGKANLSLSAAAAMLRGYHSVCPLLDIEKKHLPLLIVCRLACSATLGAFSYQQNPENEYLLLHAEPAWRALEMLWPYDGNLRMEMRQAVNCLFDQACLYSTMSRHESNVTSYDLVIPDPGVADLFDKVRVNHVCDSSSRSALNESPQKKQKVEEKSTNGKTIVTFVSGNKRKLEEALRILNSDAADESLPFYLTSEQVDLPELQGDPFTIARQKCLLAVEKVGGGAIAEDTSVCFTALNGLPGPYIKWFLDSCGHDGLNKLISAYDDKSAYAQTVVAFCKGPGHEPVIFDGRTYGKIVSPRGHLDKLSIDPIFEPNEGEGKTYAEMTTDEKDAISHRSRAFQQLRDYLKKFGSDVLS